MNEVEKENIYVLPMVAVNGYRSRSGELLVELMDKFNIQHKASMHLFPNDFIGCEGRVFDVKLTASGFVMQVFPSSMMVSDLFDTTVGYVDYYDDRHGHYHIYDKNSRHFVAHDVAGMKISIGGFVEFCPLIPKFSKFKSAVVTKSLQFTAGVSQFGTFYIEVLEINVEGGWYTYSVLSELPETEEGWFREIGKSFPDIYTLLQLHVGQRLRAVMYLKRYKRGEEKTNYIAKLLDV